MGVGTTEALKLVDIVEKDDSLGVVEYTTSARGLQRLSFQVIFAGYTSVTVKIQASLDSVTFADVTDFTISTTGDIVSGEIGPYEKIRIHVTATLSGGADSLEVWMARSVQPR